MDDVGGGDGVVGAGVVAHHERAVVGDVDRGADERRRRAPARPARADRGSASRARYSSTTPPPARGRRRSRRGRRRAARRGRPDGRPRGCTRWPIAASSAGNALPVHVAARAHDHAARRPSRLGEEPGQLAVADHEVVRPLEPAATPGHLARPRRPAATAGGHHHEVRLARPGARPQEHRDEQRRARRRVPRAAEAAPARGLVRRRPPRARRRRRPRAASSR